MTDPKQRFRVALAVHVFLRRGDDILMLRRANTGYADGLLSVPAGHLDGGESVIAAAIRETAEEVGIELAPGDVRVVGVMHRREEEERVDFFVAATGWRGEIVNNEPHKCAELLWAPLSTPPPDTVPYVREAISAYSTGNWFSTFGWT
ncbi:MAG TPA: NUDIX domain-containing protein [Tepidiformaceae bacterium]